MDTFNKFMVGVKGEQICILKPPSAWAMTPEEALLLAAWLRTRAETQKTTMTFDEIYQELTK